MIRHKIRNGEVGFMADAADDGNAGSGNGTRYDLFVKCPEFFDGTATAPNDDDLGFTMLIQEIKGVGDGERSFHALHGCWREDNACQGITSAQHAQHIAQGGCLRRGDNTNYSGLRRKWTFTFLVKQSLGR